MAVMLKLVENLCKLSYVKFSSAPMQDGQHPANMYQNTDQSVTNIKKELDLKDHQPGSGINNLIFWKTDSILNDHKKSAKKKKKILNFHQKYAAYTMHFIVKQHDLH